MALFGKTPTHVKIINHPLFAWASIGVMAVSAASLVGGAVNGVAQALRKRTTKPAQPTQTQPEQQVA